MSPATLVPQSAPEYNERVEGTWGEFQTSSGRVSYVMTNARLGQPDSPDLEMRLTRRLRPVREVLGVSDLRFDQLLQRDLDDHRVATQLVPYLLRQSSVGPAFFPPILAILLPFDMSGRPGDFPLPDAPSEVIENEMKFHEERYGNAFRVRRFIEDNGDFSNIRYAKLSWNEEAAKVVVLDGQHRAMALLAIDRTNNNGWEDAGRGARYRHFYEDRVRAALAENPSVDLSAVQVPITVCWFPDRTGPSGEPDVAARKLFVDVNKTAKPPSQDRVVLLSDSDLLNVFTRALLDELRGSNSDPPLYAIEYDNPTNRLGPPSRWSAISNLQSLRLMVERTVFGPRKYIVHVDIPIRGRQPEDEDAFMREQLDVPSLMSSQVPGAEAFRREEIKRVQFPRHALGVLTDGFLAGWGAGLLYLLGHLEPFKAHHDALRQLDAEWQPADASAIEALAREAIFEGVGMYWILRDSERHYRDETRGNQAEAPAIVKAWRRLSERRSEFFKLRAARYLGADDDAAVSTSEAAYEVFVTQACQGGLALLLATLCNKADVTGRDIAVLAEGLTHSLNRSLAQVTADGQSRRLCLARNISIPFNRIADMNATRVIEFRYLWMELLCTPEGLSQLNESAPNVDQEVLLELRDRARSRYAQQLIDERIGERIRMNRYLTRRSVMGPVSIEVTSGLASALTYWFGVSRQDFEAWAREANFDVGTEERDELEDEDSGTVLDEDL